MIEESAHVIGKSQSTGGEGTRADEEGKRDGGEEEERGGGGGGGGG